MPIISGPDAGMSGSLGADTQSLGESGQSTVGRKRGFLEHFGFGGRDRDIKIPPPSAEPTIQQEVPGGTSDFAHLGIRNPADATTPPSSMEAADVSPGPNLAVPEGVTAPAPTSLEAAPQGSGINPDLASVMPEIPVAEVAQASGVTPDMGGLVAEPTVSAESAGVETSPNMVSPETVESQKNIDLTIVKENLVSAGKSIEEALKEIDRNLGTNLADESISTQADPPKELVGSGIT